VWQRSEGQEMLRQLILPQVLCQTVFEKPQKDVLKAVVAAIKTK
jgi:hypothetical protein